MALTWWSRAGVPAFSTGMLDSSTASSPGSGWGREPYPGDKAAAARRPTGVGGGRGEGCAVEGAGRALLLPGAHGSLTGGVCGGTPACQMMPLSLNACRNFFSVLED